MPAAMYLEIGGTLSHQALNPVPTYSAYAAPTMAELGHAAEDRPGLGHAPNMISPGSPRESVEA